MGAKSVRTSRFRRIFTVMSPKHCRPTISEMLPPRRKETTEVQRPKDLTWHRAGKTIRAIVVKEGTPRSTVYDIIRRARERPDNHTQNAQRPGRPERLSETAKRKLVQHAAMHSQDTIIALRTRASQVPTYLATPYDGCWQHQESTAGKRRGNEEGPRRDGPAFLISDREL